MSRRSVFYPKGKERSIKIINALIGLLFLVTIAAMPPALPLDSDSDVGSVITEESFFSGKWIPKNDTPEQGGFGEAVVGTGKEIYIARCYDINDNPAFWRYDSNKNKWDNMTTSGFEKGAFRNGAALAWDHDNHIYALLGGRYKAEDNDYCLFYRYATSNNSWKNLTDTLTGDVRHGQGAGDAITWANGYSYVIMGNRIRKSVFARYNCRDKSWELLSLPRSWKNKTDGGASLVWTGGKYLYALQGETNENNGSKNNNFSRYDIDSNTWEDMANISEGSCGVGDGGSLLWIGKGMYEYANYIFALGGRLCIPRRPRR
ncbi:hypothetical protein C5S32_12500 [ANME-1 cluster archaeon GoMg1]|nr:hypothetical protein [ANME-1 cluster archaeon GoMg1]